MAQVRTGHGKKRRAEGAGAHTEGGVGGPPSVSPAPAAALAPTPRPGQSVAGIEAAIPNPCVTLA